MSFDLAYSERKPTSGSEDLPIGLVLLHGYGSNDLDLLELSDSLSPSLHVISLRAPISMGPQANAWFELDWDASGIRPNQEQALISRDAVSEFLRLVPQKFGVSEKLAIGGFSQGAMMSLGLVLQAPELFSRLIMMSGRVLPAFVADTEEQSLTGISALVQHGLQDQVLPYSGGRDSAKLLTERGATVVHREYPMGHQVSMESLGDLAHWMKAT